MLTNSYNITPAANWDGPHGTGWIQDRAGRGMPTERAARGMAIRAGQNMQPIPRVASPLQANEAAAFAEEVRPPHRNVAADMVVAGVLGFALTRAVQHRRAR